MSERRPDWDDAAIEAGWLLWCFSEGYGLPEDRATLDNWLREPDRSLHPDDVVEKKQLLALGHDLIAAIRALDGEQR